MGREQERVLMMDEVLKESSTSSHRLGTNESKGDGCDEVQGGK